jgi:hypothetical protein
MNRTGLAEMFPKASEYLGVDPVMTSGSFMEGKGDISTDMLKNLPARSRVFVAHDTPSFLRIAHLRQMSSINQLVSIAIQLQNDLRLTNHKFIAHQIALLYVSEKRVECCIPILLFTRLIISSPCHYSNA